MLPMFSGGVEAMLFLSLMRSYSKLLLTIVSMLACISCSKNQPAYRTEATVREVMDSMLEPNADFLWDAVSTRSTKDGVIEKAPRTDEDWKELREHAISLREATNVIQIPNRNVAKAGEKAGDPRIELTPELIQTMIESDRTTWANHAHELYDAVGIYLKGIDAKNVDAITDAGGDIDKACEDCHRRYWYPNENKGQSGSVRPK